VLQFQVFPDEVTSQSNSYTDDRSRENLISLHQTSTAEYENSASSDHYKDSPNATSSENTVTTFSKNIVPSTISCPPEKPKSLKDSYKNHGLKPDISNAKWREINKPGISNSLFVKTLASAIMSNEYMGGHSACGKAPRRTSRADATTFPAIEAKYKDFISCKCLIVLFKRSELTISWYDNMYCNLFCISCNL
jgi:hypothetical protein